MIFDAHACRRLADGVSVLRVDTRVDCAADSYTMIQMVGWLMGVCWVFGVPFYWLVSLLTNKEAIQTTGEGGQATVAAQRFVRPILQTSQRVDRAPTHRSRTMRCVIWCLLSALARPPARPPPTCRLSSWKPTSRALGSGAREWVQANSF